MKGSKIFQQSSSLLTDLYQLTMAYAFWKNNLSDTEAVFHMFFRRQPFKGGFAVAAGLELVIDFINNFSFTKDDILYLETLKGNDGSLLFEKNFLDYLEGLTFQGDISAVPEGTVVFPYEPLVSIKGSIIFCQLIESPLLNLINFSTLIATKSARVCHAAGSDPVLEFGLRRAQGMDGAMTASRSAYIGGCSGTSNALAGKLFGIPVKGTMAHSWITAFDEEGEAFQKYADVCPNNIILLVDTFDSIKGVKKAIEVGKNLEKKGHFLEGIRLDSGDLAYLSCLGRKLLDEAGFYKTKIIASNDLDEKLISNLKQQGAKIDVWGVGTNLVTGDDQSALDGVYKLSAIRANANSEWKYKLKLSEQMAKVSNPGILQIRRFSSREENIADMIYDKRLFDAKDKEVTIIDPMDSTRKKRIMSHNVTYKDLLEPIFKDGKCVYKSPSLSVIREKVKKELKEFHSGIKRFINPHQYVVGLEENLYELKIRLIEEIRN